MSAKTFTESEWDTIIHALHTAAAEFSKVADEMDSKYTKIAPRPDGIVRLIDQFRGQAIEARRLAEQVEA